MTISFRWSKEEFIRFQQIAFRNSRHGRRFFRIAFAAGVVFVLLTLVKITHRPIDWTGLLLTSFFSAFSLASPLWMRRLMLAQYALSPDRDMEVSFDISEDGIRTKTRTVTSEQNWDYFHRVHRTQDGFLLYHGETAVHWFPISAFCDTGEIDRFTEFAHSKGKVMAA